MFCSKCGNLLPDDAKFCGSCGTPVVNNVINQPVEVEEPVEIPAPETVETAPETSVYAQPETSVYEQPETSVYEQPTAPVFEQQPIQPAAPVFEQQPIQQAAPVFEQQPIQQAAPVFEQQPIQQAAPVFEQQPIQQAAPVFEQQQAQQAAPVFEQQPIQQAAPVFGQQAQPVYNQMPQQTYAGGQPPMYNNMGMQNDAPQNWGPLMQPKKKSKAPIIITLSVIALLIAVGVLILCLTFCGKDDVPEGASSAEDAVEEMFDAINDMDYDDLKDLAHPMYVKFVDSYDAMPSSITDGVTEKEFMEKLISRYYNISDDMEFTDVKITNTEKMDSADIEEVNEQMETTYEQLENFDVELPDKDTYKVDEGKWVEVTYKLDGDEEEIKMSVVKINGKWYIYTD